MMSGEKLTDYGNKVLVVNRSDLVVGVILVEMNRKLFVFK